MGVITLALIAVRRAGPTPTAIPFWVKVSCAVAIALGTYLGGWRIIRTMGKGLVEIEPPRAWPPRRPLPRSSWRRASSASRCRPPTSPPAPSSAAASAGPAPHVRWAVAGRMVVAWFITLPMAALVGAAMWWIGNVVGGGSSAPW